MRSRWLPRVVLGMVMVYLAAGLGIGVRNTARRLGAAVRTAGLPPARLRALAFGPRYVAAIDEIRRAIPVDEPYLLGELDEPCSLLWVRFDLLPRRAMVERGCGTRPEPAFDCWRQQVRWEVVAVGAGRPPLYRERPVAVPPGCPPAPWMGPPR